jgi:hypothetical protein
MSRLGNPILAIPAALLLVFCPLAVYIITCAFTEPLMVLFLVLTVYSVRRVPFLTPVFLGLLLATKQYTVFFIPAIYFLLPRPLSFRGTSMFLGLTLLTILLVTLPIALWDWPAFRHSTIDVLARANFRYDSLSYPAFYGSRSTPPATWYAYVLVVVAYAFCFWRLPPGARSFCYAIALAGIMLFAFNRAAFGNYYFFLLGALLITLPLETKTTSAGMASPQAVPSAAKPRAAVLDGPGFQSPCPR